MLKISERMHPVIGAHPLRFFDVIVNRKYSRRRNHHTASSPARHGAGRGMMIPAYNVKGLLTCFTDKPADVLVGHVVYLVLVVDSQ